MKWISVKDRLPEPGISRATNIMDVNVVLVDGKPTIARYIKEMDREPRWRAWSEPDDQEVTVTHWYPVKDMRLDMDGSK